MTTLYYSHPDCLLHDTGNHHPECSDRLKAIEAALAAPEFDGLVRLSPPMGTEQQIGLVHTAQHIQKVRDSLPQQGAAYLDADTVLSPGSQAAALRAVGAVCHAVDQVIQGKAHNAFCAIRPPGHHAEPEQAMGFCLFNNVAIAAQYARLHYQLQRVAIVDFDVHHGNGTQTAFYNEPSVLYLSSHEMPHYPGTGQPTETGGDNNIVNVPLFAGEGGAEFRARYEHVIFPALRHFKPELLLISAGFDGHSADPLANINLVEADYRWVTQQLMAIAEVHCQGRIISVLEGGYQLKALAASVALHIKTLMDAGPGAA